MKTILVVDDHRLIFDGLRAVFGTGFRFHHAENLSKARELMAAVPVSVCVIDITLKGESGMELLREVPRSVHAYVLTMHKSAELATLAKSMGARGYFLKDESLNLLVEAIKAPLKREFWTSEEIRRLLDQREEPESPLSVLTQRELQIFVLIAEGRNYREIAERLSISPKTVNVHRENLMAKLKIQSAVDIVKLSARLGLTV